MFNPKKMFFDAFTSYRSGLETERAILKVENLKYALRAYKAENSVFAIIANSPEFSEDRRQQARQEFLNRLPKEEETQKTIATLEAVIAGMHR